MDRGGTRVELELTRETLKSERLVARGEEQVTIEGEATLPGSMRDAVTVLSVQAQAHVSGIQAGMGEAALRGRVCFQVLYTQGDLTRIRALETSCDFTHTLRMAEVTPQMRLDADAVVEETSGSAASGRMTLRAQLGVRMDAFETQETDVVTGVRGAPEGTALQTKMQSVVICRGETLGTGKTLVREEFDLPDRLEVGDVLSATACVSPGEISGGNGRVGVSGVIEVRVLHRAKENGRPLVSTIHELPYQLSIDAQADAGAQMQAMAEVIDVMADSAEAEKGRTLRVEAEVLVTLRQCRQEEKTLLEDLYTTQGDIAEPVAGEMDVLTFEEKSDVRESVRIQASLPKDALPMDTLLAAFVEPVVTGVSPAGRRLDAEGLMGITLIYLPVDSDIPCAVHMHEPFAMTFPVEAGEGVCAQAYPIETSIGPTTSDRTELRCVVGLRVCRHGMRKIRSISDVTMRPPEKQECGFVIVWPAAGETRWETARRLRVAQENLIPAGKQALLAFRK